MPFGSVADVEKALRAESYLPDRGLATAVFLATSMGRPLLLEGEAGVGKTEVGKTLARILDADLIRLQCYEGIDASQALYEWDYARQLLYARALQEGEVAAGERVAELYGPEFLVERPLLRAIRAGAGAVLLVDELDRADDEFEAFLLEVLSDFTVTVPELATIAASEPPAVVITSNRTRELHDALKRRCLYHWIDFPDVEREAEIIRLRAPGVEDAACAVGRGDGVAPARARSRQAPGRGGGDRLGAGSLPAGRDVGRRRGRPGDDGRRGEEPRGPGARGSRLGRARRLGRRQPGGRRAGAHRGQLRLCRCRRCSSTRSPSRTKSPHRTKTTFAPSGETRGWLRRRLKAVANDGRQLRRARRR